MEKIANGFWDYADRWRRIFTQERRLEWDGSWFRNDYCRDCRFCCGKQDSDYPFPMPLRESQDRPGLDHAFYLLDRLTPYLAREGCKSCGSAGCKLETGQKPVACGLFPIVLVNGALFLYQNCPAVIFTPLIRFMELAEEAARFLSEFDFNELRHLSLWLTEKELSRSYINLRITLFDDSGKKIVFE